MMKSKAKIPHYILFINIVLIMHALPFAAFAGGCQESDKALLLGEQKDNMVLAGKIYRAAMEDWEKFRTQYKAVSEEAKQSKEPSANSIIYLLNHAELNYRNEMEPRLEGTVPNTIRDHLLDARIMGEFMQASQAGTLITTGEAIATKYNAFKFFEAAKNANNSAKAMSDSILARVNGNPGYLAYCRNGVKNLTQEIESFKENETNIAKAPRNVQNVARRMVRHLGAALDYSKDCVNLFDRIRIYYSAMGRCADDLGAQTEVFNTDMGTVVGEDPSSI